MENETKSNHMSHNITIVTVFTDAPLHFQTSKQNKDMYPAHKYLSNQSGVEKKLSFLLFSWGASLSR